VEAKSSGISGAARAQNSTAGLRRILVVVDPTAHEQPALQKALRIATRCRSSLELFICDVQQEIPDSWAGGARFDEYREMTRNRLLSELNRLAEPIKAQGLRVSTVCEWHALLEQGIGHHVIRSQPDLVMKDTHRHMAAHEGILGRTDWTLIRQVPAALLLVRGKDWPGAPQIAAAVDPCHPADRPVALDEAIVDLGRTLADTLEGSLDVCHVVQTPPHLPGDMVTHEQKAAAHVRARNLVKGLAWRAAAGTQFVEGAPVEGLQRLVRERRPDVLVMGVAARSRFSHVGPAGTAAQILESLDCDLLVVKPAGFVSPLLVTED
jgi:universal stress protein E